MQEININELKSHPRNNEFFDDMTGEKWNEFLELIKAHGVIEPIVVTQNRTIVSGHQRVRACKELGIPKINCEVRIYSSEDEVLRDLIETNIRRRGDVGGSTKQISMRIKELERIYGIKQGGSGYYGNQHEELRNNFATPKTQDDLAKEMNMSVRTLQNYKKLTEMIPELSDLVDTGIVSNTTALAIVKQLSQSEQEQLIANMDVTKKITQKKVQEAIDKMKSNSPAPEVKEVQVVPEDYEDLKRNNIQLQKDNEKLKNKTNEVVNLREEVENYKKDYHTMKRINDEQNTKITELKSEIETLKKPVDNYNDQNYIERLKRDARLFYYKANEYIKEFGGYAYLSDDVNIIPIEERQRFITAVQNIKAMALKIEENIQRNYKEN